jgi:putative transposase
MDKPPDRRTPAHMPVISANNRSVIVYVTVCTEKRKRILALEEIHRLLVTVWQSADGWRVGRYVIMPDHIHLFCAPARLDSPGLKPWIKYWKALATGLWPRKEEKPVWQKSFWDTQLRLGESYAAKWEYVMKNPVRAGLCADPDVWPFQGVMNTLAWHD